MPQPTPVPYDPELVPGLEAFIAAFEPFPLRADTITASRQHIAALIPSLGEQTRGRSVTCRDYAVPGPPGAPEVTVTVVAPAAGTEQHGRAPAVLGIHGGGMVLGNRFFGTPELVDWAERYGTVGVAVEYRLAPEHRGPAAAEDCYAALGWMASHAPELGIDPTRILVSGASAGGGLAAVVALMARDRNGPQLAGQLLNCPMVDDRNSSVSARQYDGIGAWDRNNNDAGWNALLGPDRQDVPAYCAPSRAADLSGLPAALIEVGAAEVFRDEAVEYASRIWAAGGSAELHVYAGAYHGFSGSSPAARVSVNANANRDSWLRRTLGLAEGRG